VAISEPTDLKTVKAEKTVAGLEDEKLIEVMLGFLAPCENADGALVPLFGGLTENGALYTRCMFMEIAARWIPADVFSVAFHAHMATVEEGGDND
jgi:hypothetical protein